MRSDFLKIGNFPHFIFFYKKIHARGYNLNCKIVNFKKT